LVAAAALALGGCSYLPSMPSVPFVGGGGDHLTNDAVEACKRKAGDLGYDGVGERQSEPTGGGKYTVILEVLGPNGYSTVPCSYDPAKGADLPPPPKAGK
jgi:hypothetical protein